jgi:predicted dehydrogenase
MNLNVCLIGAGDMGKTHGPAWMKVEGARVLAVADPLADRARALAEKVGAPRWFTDYREALQVEGLNAASVAVPTSYHRECTEAALDAGCHVLCEKPIALTVADAEAMIAHAQRCGRKLAVGFCKRFMGQVLKVKELVQNGTLGRPVLYRHTSGLEIRYKLWIMDRNMGGGPIVDILCHYVDQCRVIFGSDPVRVKASGLTFSKGAPELPGVDPQVDTFSLIVDYASGDILSVNMTWGLARGVKVGSLEDCLGPRAALKIEPAQVTLQTGGGQEEVFAGLPLDMYEREIADFAAAIRDDRPVAASGADGVMALRVSLAAIEAIQSGESVRV